MASKPKNNPKKPSGLQFKLKVNLWTVAITVLVVFFVVPVMITAFQMVGGSNRVDISQVLSDVKAGKVDKILIESDKLVLTYKDGSTKNLAFL